MKIAVASDHRGIDMKQKILEMIRTQGQDAIDYGPNSTESVDYPDFAGKVASDISAKQIDRGILICGTGIGMCIVANKFDGVRAAGVHDDLTETDLLEFARRPRIRPDLACGNRAGQIRTVRRDRKSVV